MWCDDVEANSKPLFSLASSSPSSSSWVSSLSSRRPCLDLQPRPSNGCTINCRKKSIHTCSDLISKNVDDSVAFRVGPWREQNKNPHRPHKKRSHSVVGKFFRFKSQRWRKSKERDGQRTFGLIAAAQGNSTKWHKHLKHQHRAHFDGAINAHWSLITLTGLCSLQRIFNQLAAKKRIMFCCYCCFFLQLQLPFVLFFSDNEVNNKYLFCKKNLSQF